MDVEARLRAAMEADDRDAVWGALEPLAELTRTDARVARLWAEALRTSPDRPALVDEAAAILEAWPADVGIVGAACDALVRREARRPVDEPPLDPRAGALAAEAAGRCLARQPQASRLDPDVGGALLALKGNALATLGPGRLADAAAALDAALALAPRASWLFDLGLVHKRARDWPAALDANRRARALAGDAHRGVLFNLALAATAVGEGALARDAWRAVGIDADAREGALPFVEGLPPAEVRLPTRGDDAAVEATLPAESAGFEIVWVQPLSPCHGVVRSPTHREAVADFGDVILFDPAPVAVVARDGEPTPRFAFLGRLRAGDERRFRFLALEQEAGQVRRLADALPDGVILYPHAERVEMVCPRCAAGDRYTKHDHLPPEAHRVVFGKLLAPGAQDLAALRDAIERAAKAQPGVLLAIPSLYEALGDTPSAGKHHKRWGAIARAAAA
ncbi:MAG: hypothetical protein KF729_07145 [Sandaracinaceae bacterium]|nr:hypothetical protein [Sandaracinaceae bacterium]